ncbi:hypothetical protein AAFF_G00289640 [Aldrovandia affinis]|uniref:Uncharacterized protein n=1 Tax=Aldrovandia affinis TaxID=143900 RepID=A0AAD7R9Q9_9TELE|nr:hypothetical protein AAFF_G00289640 [Aldrovandia affinis]
MSELDSPDQHVYSTVGQTSHNSPGAQNTEKSGQSSHPNRLAAVCLGLLYTLLLTAAAVRCVLYMSVSQNYSLLERDLEELRANNSTMNKDKDLLQRDYNSDQYCPLRSQKRVCRPCPEGWKQRNSKCYYFSTEEKSWQGSRSECLKQGADLVIIESEGEQILDEGMAS